MRRSEILICLITIMCFGCKLQDDGYDQSILQWQKERLANLIKEDGWATLAGLFPLREGKQTFGSGKGNSILFPPFAPEELGSFIVSDDSVHLVVNQGIDIRVADQPVSCVLLAPVAAPLLCTHGRLQWLVIKRSDQFLIRLRDIQHPARESLTSLPYYTIDKKWRLKATFHPYDSMKILALPNVLDMMVNRAQLGSVPRYIIINYNM